MSDTNANWLAIARDAARREREPAPVRGDDTLLHAIRHQWPLILAVTFLAALAAWIFAAMQPNRYRSTVIAAVTPLVSSMPKNDQIRGIEALDGRTIIATVAALASTPVTLAQASADGYRITAVAMPNTHLLRVNVEGKDPRQAEAIANRVPQLLANQTRTLFKYYEVLTVSPAGAGELVFPRVDRAIAAGIAAGLVAGILIAWARERFRDQTAAAR